MGRNNFKKALKHIESRSVDKNVARLNDELKKTGMLSEKMTTSTVLPPTETQPYIPPTDEPAPLGDFSDLDNFTWDTDAQGDGSSISHDVSQLQTTDVNGETKSILEIPSITTTDGSGFSGTPLGLAFGVNVAVSGSPLGYINEGGFVFVYQINNVFSVTHTEFSRQLVNYYEANTFVQKSIYLWSNLKYRGGQLITPVERNGDKGLYGHSLLIPVDSDNNVKRNTIRTDLGQPRITVLNRFEDPNSPDYYEGNFARYMANMLGLSKKALEYLDQKSVEVAASYPTTNTPLDKVGGFKGIPKGKGIYPTDKDGNPYNPQTGLPVKASAGKDDEVALDTIPYEPPSPGPGGYKRPGSYDPGKFYDLKNDPSQFPSPNLPSTGPGRSSVPDDAKVALAPTGDPSKAPPPIYDPMNPGMPRRPGSGGRPFNAPIGPQPLYPMAKKKKKKQSVVAHHEPQGDVLSEGWHSPDHTNVEKDPKTRWFNPNAGTDSAKWFDPKQVKPIYPEEPPKMIDGYNVKSNLVPKPVEKLPTIKITKKDLLRNHRLKDSEIEEMMRTIDRINKFIADHPEELIYAKSRYPKHDPRLAELNWKMDQMLNASNEYLDKQFPENERLFNRLKDATQKTIELTDPETYKKDPGKLTSMGNLAKVDSVMNHYEPKDRVVSKIKVERKKSVNRFFVKPKRPDRPAYLRKKKKGKPNF